MAIPTVMATCKHRQGSDDIQCNCKITSRPREPPVSASLSESRSITLATVQDDWNDILWLCSNSKHMALAC